MEQKIVTIEGKYIFNAEEKANLSLELANKNCMKSDVESQKKSRMADFTQQLTQINTDIQTVSVNLVRGYEFRDYKCTVEKDFKKKVKVYRDATNGNIIDTRPLTQADYQVEMEDIRSAAEKKRDGDPRADVKAAKRAAKKEQK